MSHGIKKETFVEADPKTTKSLTFDLLDKLYKKVDENQALHLQHIGVCDRRFHNLENRKRKDTRLSALWGIFGGFIAVVAYWLKGIFE